MYNNNFGQPSRHQRYGTKKDEAILLEYSSINHQTRALKRSTVAEEREEPLKTFVSGK